MPPDSTDTKRRLLDAACEEFARYGLAGARVDRIAEQAKANKRLIYAYYGNKEELFDTVWWISSGVLADAVPFSAEDLAGYAGALFDYMVEHPAMVRLTMWKLLERPEVSPKRRGRRTGRRWRRCGPRNVRAGWMRRSDPVDLLVLVIGAGRGLVHQFPVAARPGRRGTVNGSIGHTPRGPRHRHPPNCQRRRLTAGESSGTRTIVALPRRAGNCPGQRAVFSPGVPASSSKFGR